MIFQMHKFHGRHFAATEVEAQVNRKNGWRDVTEEEFYASNKPKKEPAPKVASADVPRETLISDYTSLFGKPPHHKMKDDTIQAAINAEIS